MAKQRCLACGEAFRRCPTTPQQSYCSSPACQRERRTVWQRNKRRTDRDYQDNQVRAHQSWSERHPDYWKAYRNTHPDQVESNRAKQRKRNLGRPKGMIANMDSKDPERPAETGIYRMTPLGARAIDNMDAWIVQITWLARA
jgi:hypothetical protein